MNSGLDLSQELAIGGQSIALGLLVVFVCLALIIAVITVLSIVLKDRKKPAEESKVEKAVSEPLPQSPVLQVQDDELLAVLTAAVAAAMESEQASTPFVIRSYKRTNGSSAWNKAGRDSQITNW